MDLIDSWYETVAQQDTKVTAIGPLMISYQYAYIQGIPSHGCLIAPANRPSESLFKR